MKLRPALLFFVLVFPTLLSFCGSVSSGPQVSGEEKSLATDFFEATNSYRASKGKRVLLRHSGLDQLAAGHAAYLKEHRGTFSLYGKNVSHYGFEGGPRWPSIVMLLMGFPRMLRQANPVCRV